MASHGPAPVNEELLREHRADWEAFTRFSKFGIIAVVVLLVLMALFLL